jgi:hypothetical protein
MRAAQWGLAGLKGRKRGGVGRRATSAAHKKSASAALQGGGDPQAKPSGAQGKGKLGNYWVRPHGSRWRVRHQVEGGEKYLPFSGGDVGGEPRPQGDAGKVDQARLKGGAEQEENLSCLLRGREVRAVTRPTTVLAREQVSAPTNASGPRGMPAATSPSRRWVTPRVEATADQWLLTGLCGAHGEGRGEADQGGRSDQEPAGLDGGFLGPLQVHIVRICHHADVRKRIPHL